MSEPHAGQKTPSLDDITIISVSYNSQDVILGMLQSVPPQTPVIVVDNASSTPLPDLLQTRPCTVICNDKNFGFGHACNIGTAAAKTKYLMFLNPDARLSPNCLRLLLEATQKYPNASAFNPRLQDSNGHMFFRRATRLRGNHGRVRLRPSGNMQVPVLSGAALFVRSADFQKTGGFDENIFLYAEDDDLSVRLEESCGPLMLIYDAVVTHFEGKSSGSSLEVTAFKEFHLARATVYTMAKHKRPFAFGQCLFRALRRFIKLRTYRSAEAKTAAVSFLVGVWSCRKDGGIFRP